MARIDHTNHNHPRTAAARAACRKNGVAPEVGVITAFGGSPVRADIHRQLTAAAIKAKMDRRYDMTSPSCTVTGTHCENCGSTDTADLTTGDQGYSACCNEIVTGTFDCRNHHG